MKRFLERGINQFFPRCYLYVLDKCKSIQLFIVSITLFSTKNRLDAILAMSGWLLEKLWTKNSLNKLRLMMAF